MKAAATLVNFLMGAAYVTIGVMTAVEMKRDWRVMGFSHFGAAVIAMAFTCGPHHLAHGLHLAVEGRSTGPLDTVSVLIGLPPGAIWALLRVEAFRGGRGDRFISGTPRWVAAAPAAGIAYGAAFAVAVAGVLLAAVSPRFTSIMLPNAFLVGIYVTIGYFLLRTQLRNRDRLGGWSVSGCSLGLLFPTCAVMHAAWAVYATSGLYAFDIHGFAIDWLSIPSALYFLWVVHGLYRDALHDWNRTVQRPAILVG